MSDTEDTTVVETPGLLATGAAVIADYLTRLPNAPGVYRMIAANGDVLYVGKAANLKKRVVAYTKPFDQPGRIARMIANTASMEFVQTASEVEALLLEANLIKRLKPRYNVHLRDDKSFPFILVTGDHAAPQIIKHRGAKNRKGEYFGPFASAYSVNRTLNTLQRAFLLRSCSDSVFESRTRPCLLYQIKRCSAPCVAKVSPEDYRHLVDQAVGFLRGKSQDVKEELSHEMETAAEALNFEKAARLRDRIRALAHVQLQQGINPETIDEADLFAAHQDGGHTCIQVFFFRSGQNWGNRAYFPKHDRGLEIPEILDSFLAQFYDDRDPPKCVIVSHEIPSQELLQQALSVKAERKVEVFVPQRGEKREVMAQAVMNARESLARRMAESATQLQLLDGVGQAFGLDEAPHRIEVYDNSHIQGTNAVGAMIVAGQEGFRKNGYRKFNIKRPETAPGDDFAMMREVLSRRFARLEQEDPDRSRGEWPDLLLIDGGKGQVSSVCEVMEDAGVHDVPVIGVSKGPDRNAGREIFHFPNGREVTLPLNSPLLFYIQRLRDEAHRFAIGAHRQKRAKSLVTSTLDDVPGIGPGRKRALLMHFGTARAVKAAALEDLRKVPGVSATTAQGIYDYFHPRG